jgi:hypothetical protein
VPAGPSSWARFCVWTYDDDEAKRTTSLPAQVSAP